MSIDYVTEERIAQKHALLELFVGRQIGSGAYRRVYALTFDETSVVKIEYCGKEFCNIAEMRVWQEVELTPIADWFAPCIEIDSFGIALIQKRTQPFKDDAEFRQALRNTRGDDRLPAFFDDVHFANFGMLNGKVVCHDYGFNHFVKDGVRAGCDQISEGNDQYEMGL